MVRGSLLLCAGKPCFVMARYLSRADLSRIAGKYIDQYYTRFGISKDAPEPIDPERLASAVLGLNVKMLPLSAIHFLPIRRTAQMDELNSTVREQEIYEEMELTPEMVKSIRTLCATCLRHFVEAKAFKIALVPSADRSMDTCTVCQTRRGHDYVVMHR